jgi:hypothetical protein
MSAWIPPLAGLARGFIGAVSLWHLAASIVNCAPLHNWKSRIFGTAPISPHHLCLLFYDSTDPARLPLAAAGAIA